MAPTYPTLRERVRSVLLEAGFKAREDTLPTLVSRGTFDLTAGAVVKVQVAWWDAPKDKKRELLGSFAAALEGAGFAVARDGDALLVSVPGERSDEK